MKLNWDENKTSILGLLGSSLFAVISGVAYGAHYQTQIDDSLSKLNDAVFSKDAEGHTPGENLLLLRYDTRYIKEQLEEIRQEIRKK